MQEEKKLGIAEFRKIAGYGKVPKDRIFTEGIQGVIKITAKWEGGSIYCKVTARDPNHALLQVGVYEKEKDFPQKKDNKLKGNRPIRIHWNGGSVSRYAA